MNTTKQNNKVNKVNEVTKISNVVNNDYKTNVIEFNKLLKVYKLKLGYCIDLLLSQTNLNPKFATLLRKAKKDSVLYKAMETDVRKSKKGYSAFYLLQYLHKVCK